MAFHIFHATGFRPGNTLIIFLLVLHCSKNSDFFNLQAKIGASKASTIHTTYIFILSPETIRHSFIIHWSLLLVTIFLHRTHH